jgi:uncharacterized short protein YbdD (DUF466 family)
MNTFKSVPTLLKNAYGWLREVSGDDAYERYLQHWQDKHAHEGGQPMSRKEFFASEQDRKWNGVRRCC